MTTVRRCYHCPFALQSTRKCFLLVALKQRFPSFKKQLTEYVSSKKHSIVHKYVYMDTVLHIEDSFKFPHVATAA